MESGQAQDVVIDEIASTGNAERKNANPFQPREVSCTERQGLTGKREVGPNHSSWLRVDD